MYIPTNEPYLHGQIAALPRNSLIYTYELTKFYKGFIKFDVL